MITNHQKMKVKCDESSEEENENDDNHLSDDEHEMSDH